MIESRALFQAFPEPTTIKVTPHEGGVSVQVIPPVKSGMDLAERLTGLIGEMLREDYTSIGIFIPRAPGIVKIVNSEQLGAKELINVLHRVAEGLSREQKPDC